MSTQSGSKLSNPSGKTHTPGGHSTFDELSHINFLTARFGDVTPFMFFNGFRNDKIPFRSEHKLRTLSLKSPLMSKINMQKNFFAIPMECILPLNWPIIYDNPINGDDVPQDSYTSVNFSRISVLFNDWCDFLHRSIVSDLNSASNWLSILLRGLIYFEYFYSYGSLLNISGYKMAGCFKYRRVDENGNVQYATYDQIFDIMIGSISSNVKELRVLYDDELRFTISSSFNINYIDSFAPHPVSWHTGLEKLRDELGFSGFADGGITLAGVNAIRQVFNRYFYNTSSSSDVPLIPQVSAPTEPCDISRLWAYQIVCARFYTNDHVDYIYSADLFRNLVNHFNEQLITNYEGNLSRTFAYNGITMPYDYLSSHYAQVYFACDYDSDEFFSGSYKLFFNYASMLLSFRRSLKYKDYFTGGRTSPLAVGNTNVAVQSGEVSVVDVTRNIQMQRFLNAVNRYGRRFSNYLEGLFPDGRNVGYDYHDPCFLGSTSDDIGNYETQNTGTDQLTEEQTITSNLANSSGRFAFEYSADRPYILVGCIHFDIRRSYVNASRKQLFVKDRFDMFNPFLQFIGDQPILRAERLLSQDGTFAYTGRYMEYKQSFDEVNGGFVSYLPTWCLKARDFNTSFNESDVLSPDFIRSRNDEFDEYFVSLTNYSLAGYFHFILGLYNDFGKAKRSMSYNPGIL